MNQPSPYSEKLARSAASGGGGSPIGRMVCPARGQAERGEDALRDEVVPALAADGRDDLSSGDVQHVVVGVAAAEARRRLRGADAVDDLRPVGVRVKPQEVPGAKPEPAAVRH